MSRYTKGPMAIVGAVAAGIFVLALIVLLFVSDYGVLPAIFMALLISLLATVVYYLFSFTSPARAGSEATDTTSTVTTKVSQPAAAAGAAPIATLDPEPEAAPEPQTTSSANATPEASPQPALTPEPKPVSQVEATPVADASSAAQERPATLDGPEGGQADDLKKIKGVGPKMEEMLNGLGFYHFHQIASWGPGEVAWVDDNLEGFKGRVSRDDWVDQAKALASGADTEFSKKVDGGNVY